MLDFRELMTELSHERPIFHSEADFQHALAWLIQRKFPQAKIRLEYPFESASGRIYVDIWVTLNGQHYAIELKYKTVGTVAVFADEKFHLKNHGAQDEGRYDYLYDVKRLEDVSSFPDCKGIAILLTNDSSYWRDTVRSTSNVTNFRLSQGHIISGKLEWLRLNEYKPTKRDDSIQLENTYHLNWQDYSNQSEFGEFRYLMLDIPKNQPPTSM